MVTTLFHYMQRETAAIAAAIATTVVMWASAFVAIRVALHGGYGPVQLATLRYAIGSVLLAIFAALRGVRIPQRRDWLSISLCGIVGFAIYAVLLNIGETRVAAGTASFVINTVPIFTAIIAMLFLGERMRIAGWIGLAISLSGTAVLSIRPGSKLSVEPALLILVAAAIAQATQFVKIGRASCRERVENIVCDGRL